jgi:hypothetical protein
MLETALHAYVLITGAWAFLALTVLVSRARAYGKSEYFTQPAGRSIAGVAYAFTLGMSPTAKESTREHVGAYVEGVGYHIGVFASLACVALALAGVAPAGIALPILRILTLLGALCGAILLIRRLSNSQLRELSSPDDYVSNLLTTALIALSFAWTFSLALEPVLFAETGALFLYAPLGKVKHCFFFFSTRYYMGAHFGRRGTLPPGP